MTVSEAFPEEWREALALWAEEQEAVREMWLFGSRAKGTHRPDSDVDIAILLAPLEGIHDWAFGAYLSDADNWQHELSAIVGRHVSLEAIAEDTPRCAEIRSLDRPIFRRASHRLGKAHRRD